MLAFVTFGTALSAPQAIVAQGILTQEPRRQIAVSLLFRHARLPGYLAEFNSKLRACVLDERFVLAETTQPEEIAVVIVHEATHARLENLGIGYDDGQRDRIEAICVRRELAFAKRLPNGHPKRERVEATLDAQAEFWSNTAFRQRDTEGRAQTLRYLGTPNWIVRVLLAISGRRTS
jgi:hypothetical protein